MQANYRGKTEVAAKAMDEVSELKNLDKELKVDAVKNDTRLDHLEKGNNELRAFLKKVQLRSLKLPASLLSFWKGTTLLALKNSVWTLRNASLKLTSAPSSSILVLQALFFRRALKMSTSRTMLLPSLLRTSLILETTLSERRLKYYLVIFPFF